jgi:hypothetical protein
MEDKEEEEEEKNIYINFGKLHVYSYFVPTLENK